MLVNTELGNGSYVALTPYALESGPVFEWTQSVLPIPIGIIGKTLEHITAGKAEEVL